MFWISPITLICWLSSYFAYLIAAVDRLSDTVGLSVAA
jgi:hypothetical protein